MDAGKLRSRVLLQRPADGQDDHGQPLTGYVGVTTVSADIRYLNGLEAIRQAGATAVARASIRIRRRTDITAKWRAVLRPGKPDEVVFRLSGPPMPSESGDTYTDLPCEVVT